MGDKNLFYFLDETGVLNKPSERFFALGILATAKPQSDINFEEDVKLRVNKAFKQEALLGVCRIDSKASDLLQLTDFLLGAVSYEYKLSRIN